MPGLTTLLGYIATPVAILAIIYCLVLRGEVAIQTHEIARLTTENAKQAADLATSEQNTKTAQDAAVNNDAKFRQCTDDAADYAKRQGELVASLRKSTTATKAQLNELRKGTTDVAPADDGAIAPVLRRVLDGLRSGAKPAVSP